MKTSIAENRRERKLLQYDFITFPPVVLISNNCQMEKIIKAEYPAFEVSFVSPVLINSLIYAEF